MITAEMMRNYMNQSQPFHIHMADGRQIDVPHGEWLSLHPSGRMFIVYTPRAFEVFNLTMVTSIRARESGENEGKGEKS